MKSRFFVQLSAKLIREYLKKQYLCTVKQPKTFKHSFAILLYGIMLDIFVALFLFRNEKTICSRNGNLDEETEEGEEMPDEEETAEETPNLTENQQ